MTRLSEYLLPTERQPPADAEAISHRLMVRAGLIRQVGAGIWSWLPAGWRAHQRAVSIIREEMDAIGAQEMLMPVLQPADPWRRTGRLGIDELFKLTDRKGSELVLAMTHEEVVTQHVAQTVRSYRELPLVLYHFQVKERDEPRPRAGVLRTREFIMKDAYSFDRDRAGLEERYELHVRAYDRIMQRTGLRFYRVESDVGMMGGLGAHEYMAPCAAGENEIALAGEDGKVYAANVEVASARAIDVPSDDERESPAEVSTPGLTTVAEVSRHLGVPEGALLKAYPVVLANGADAASADAASADAASADAASADAASAAAESADPAAGTRAAGGTIVLVLLRGDHRVNEIKLAAALGAHSRPARPEEIAAHLGPPGFIGPVGLDGRVEIVLDEAVADGCYVTGANRPDAHLRGVRPGRDFPFRRADIRTVQVGDTVDGHPIAIERAIEVANIFKLGTRYSEPLGARYLDEHGREQLVWMGSYGIGPARIVAAAVEQFADEHGISWPRALAPFAVHLVVLGRPGTPERELADALYAALLAEGLDVLYDDRDAGAGEKFADAELLGAPLRLTLGARSLASGEIEAQARRGRAAAPGLALGGEPAALARAARKLWQGLP